MSNQRSLIDDWLPIAPLGVESRREQGASSALPPVRFLHIWWARRSLTPSRAAILGTLLPAWSDTWPNHLLEQFPTPKHYRDWFVELLGIRGDPVAAMLKIREAVENGNRIPNPYTGPRAFTVAPEKDHIETLRRLMEYRWGTGTPVVMDPTAGGGSIPFEAIRFGLPTIANELNPVASFVLEGTLNYPARFGPGLAEDIAHWGQVWTKRLRERLTRFFPEQPGESVETYLFARTVACPETGKPVPLSPNWWLLKKKRPFSAARLVAEPHIDECRFEIVTGDDIDFDPGRGTVKNGVGRSPWTRTTVSGDYIKAEAQAGRMGSQLYAVATKTGRRAGMRPPNRDDLSALEAAREKLDQVNAEWLLDDIVPTEDIPSGSKTREAIRYGMYRWSQMFTSRQLLVMGTMVEELRSLQEEIRAELDADRAMAVNSYLAKIADKIASYNNLSTRYDPTRGVRSIFDRHDFSFKWSYAEMNVVVPRLGIEWAVNQVVNAYRGIAELLEPSRQALFPTRPERASDLITLYNGDAADLPVEDRSVHAVVMDPPYYQNVQYAELSDFFYVWLKRTAGRLYPDLFSAELTEKATEAVANPARFKEFDGRNATALARADYQAKMTRIFAEAHRVLVDGGVLTVMFSHKDAGAWDTLGQSLIESGFQIDTSWPVHSESEHSLHQAKKAAAASNILLACHKRPGGGDPVWWDDLVADVRRVARDSAERFRAEGVDGVDLYISTFGPVLSVISRRWPVLTSEVDPDTGEPRRLRPEEALTLARREVADMRLTGMLEGRKVEFDPVTDWYLLAWDSFRAADFPYDDARKLALALGIDIDQDLRRARIVVKKQSMVRLQEPKQRRRTGLADTEAESFGRLIDAAHALMVTYQEDGIRGAEAFLRRTRLGDDSRFSALLQAMVYAIPRTKIKGRFVRPEAKDLDRLGILFPDLEFPDEPPTVEPAQTRLELS